MAQYKSSAWTPEQEELLRAMFEAGNSKVLVAAKLKRTVSAVKTRAGTLKISVQRKKPAVKVHGESAFLHPTPELRDDTPIENVHFSTRIRNALQTAGINTVGHVRETTDGTLLALQNFGKGSVAHLRKTLGLPSKDGVRPGPKEKGK
jgi:DNA-directed RNA polymerase alpha subunit